MQFDIADAGHLHLNKYLREAEPLVDDRRDCRDVEVDIWVILGALSPSSDLLIPREQPILIWQGFDLRGEVRTNVRKQLLRFRAGEVEVAGVDDLGNNSRKTLDST